MNDDRLLSMAASQGEDAAGVTAARMLPARGLNPGE